VETPVLNGYLFVHISPDERLTTLQTQHVTNIVRFEKKDVIIPDKQIDAMKRMLGQTEHDVEVNFDKLRPGQKVKINVGMMSGLIAELIKVHGKNRVTLRIPEISFNLMVDLPGRWFEVL